MAAALEDVGPTNARPAPLVVGLMYAGTELRCCHSGGWPSDSPEQFSSTCLLG